MNNMNYILKPLKFLRLVTNTNRLDLLNLIIYAFTIKMLISVNPEWSILGATVLSLVEGHKRYTDYLANKNNNTVDDLKAKYDTKLQEMQGNISRLQLAITGAQPAVAKSPSAGRPMPSNLNQFPKGM